jgi:Zn-dependent protease with chaperone function
VVYEALVTLGEDPDDARALCERVWVFDSDLPGAAVRGRAWVVTRGLLDCDGLAAVLGHERAHLRAFDARLTEALERLGFWRDPLGLPEEALEPGEGVAVILIWTVLRVLVALAGCRPTRWLLSPLWAMHWRACEYRADAHAASLGVGEDLIAHLEEFEQVLDRPQLGLLRGSYEHPPVALRISRLRKLLDAEEE